MRILGIESSCDDTAVAIYDANNGIIGHAINSQKTHKNYGGVVPELASRDHIKNIVFLVDEAFNQAQIAKHNIDAIAYTAGPGLIGSLLTGACFAKGLAFGLEKPALAIHHLEAHILAAKLSSPNLEFPFLALLVSGGHTQLILAKSLGAYSLLGETLDDALGEAFDKTAKLMGIPYPGGAALAKLADQPIDEENFPPFPRPMLNKPGLNFSFSGLKTHAVTTWQNCAKDPISKIKIAKSFQDAIVETLVEKCRRALDKTGVHKLVVAGGVAANQELRQNLKQLMKDLGGECFFPQIEYCTDNGAMVAYAGFLHFINGSRDANLAILVKARWSLETC